MKGVFRRRDFLRSQGAHSSAIRLWRDEARRTFRYAFFLRYYALFEAQLKSLCDHFAEELDLPLKLADISGPLLDRANKFMSRLAGAKPMNKHRSWRELKCYSQIRNLIIHADGQISDPSQISKELRQFIKNTRSLHIDLNHRVCMRKPFCYRAVGHIHQFLLDVSWLPR